jgi:DNA-binding transcriptional LysR family regulator
MSTNFEYYKVFYYVAKYKNFTHAAQVLYINQPSVTRYIHLLEQDMGCRLFIRSKHGVSLTPEGEILYSHVRPACEHFFDGEKELNSVKDLKDGTVYIGATETALRCFLLGKLHVFRQSYPGIKLKIVCNNTPQSITNLFSGKYELGLAVTPIEEREHMVIKPVRQVHDILIYNPEYYQFEDRQYHLTELTEYPMVSLSDTSSMRIFYDNFYARHGLTFKVDIELNSADLIVPLIKQGMGLGFIPEEIAQLSLDAGAIAQIKLVEAMPTRTICTILDKQRPLSLATRKLLSILTEDVPAD